MDERRPVGRRFERSVVRLYRGREGERLSVQGAGFLVDDRHILTCDHVVRDCLSGREGDGAPSDVVVDFPFLPSGARGRRLHARVGPRRRDDRMDVAGLTLLDPAPDDACAAPLVSAEEYWDHGFWASGFPKSKDTGEYAEGKMLGPDGRRWVMMQSESAQGRRVQKGYSGGPVYDKDLHGVAGMVVVADDQAAERVAFMIPIAVLGQTWSDVLGPAIKPPNPYRGLEPLREDDWRELFGRDDVVDDVLGRLDRHELCVLSGASGSGKSSVLNAGLVPRLRGRRVPVVLVRGTGEQPFRALAEALLAVRQPRTDDRPHSERLTELAAALEVNGLDVDLRHSVSAQEGQPVILVIDQLEEVFTVCRDEELREAFLRRLLQAARLDDRRRPTGVVLSLRSDYLSRLESTGLLDDHLPHGVLTLSSLSAEALGMAIGEPARRVGAEFEPGLVDEIVRDVQGRPGCLPELQFVLTALWDNQRDGVLTLEAYDSLGRVSRGLAHRAEESFAELDDRDKQAVRRVFVQLVQLNQADRGMRRPVSADDLLPEDWPVVQMLADERLVVVSENGEGQPVAMIAHEALVDAWPRLREWVDVTSADLERLDAEADRVIARYVTSARYTSAVVPFAMAPVLMKLSRGLSRVYGVQLDDTSEQVIRRRMLRSIAAFQGGSALAINLAKLTHPAVMVVAAVGQATTGAALTRAAGRAWKHYFRLRFIGAAEPAPEVLEGIVREDLGARVRNALRRSGGADDASAWAGPGGWRDQAERVRETARRLLPGGGDPEGGQNPSGGGAGSAPPVDPEPSAEPQRRARGRRLVDGLRGRVADAARRVAAELDVPREPLPESRGHEARSGVAPPGVPLRRPQAAPPQDDTVDRDAVTPER